MARLPSHIVVSDFKGLQMTIKVKVTRWFHLRYLIGRWLLLFAAWVMRCNIVVDPFDE